jgi:hypothetical protein
MRACAGIREDQQTLCGPVDQQSICHVCMVWHRGAVGACRELARRTHLLVSLSLPFGICLLQHQYHRAF